MINSNRPDPFDLGVLGGDLLDSTLQGDESTGLLDLIERMGGVQSLGTPEEQAFTDSGTEIPTSRSTQPSLPLFGGTDLQSVVPVVQPNTAETILPLQPESLDPFIGGALPAASVSNDGLTVHFGLKVAKLRRSAT